MYKLAVKTCNKVKYLAEGQKKKKKNFLTDCRTQQVGYMFDVYIYIHIHIHIQIFIYTHTQKRSQHMPLEWLHYNFKKVDLITFQFFIYKKHLESAQFLSF